MNGVNWPPKNKKRNWQTNKQRKTEKEREKIKYIVIHKVAAEKYKNNTTG